MKPPLVVLCLDRLRVEQLFSKSFLLEPEEWIDRLNTAARHQPVALHLELIYWWKHWRVNMLPRLSNFSPFNWRSHFWINSAFCDEILAGTAEMRWNLNEHHAESLLIYFRSPLEFGFNKSFLLNIFGKLLCIYLFFFTQVVDFPWIWMHPSPSSANTSWPDVL